MKNKEPFITHAYLTLSNHGGMKLQIDDNGETARLKLYERTFGWQKIKFAPSGRPYLTNQNETYYLDEFIKVRTKHTA